MVASIRKGTTMRPGWRWGTMCGLLLPASALAAAMRGADGWWSDRGVAIALLGLLVAAGYYGMRWRRAARTLVRADVADPQQPRAGMSPADLRFLSQSAHDARGVAADLVDMAVRGYLRISRESKVVGHRWRLLRQPDVGEQALLPSQQALAARLFARTESVELTEANIRRIANACEEHEQAVRDQRRSAPAADNKAIAIVGIALSLPFTVLALLLAQRHALPALGVVLVLTATLHAWAELRLKRPSADRGEALREWLHGFQRHLAGDDAAELAPVAVTDAAVAIEAARFQSLLPYALALEVEAAWTQRFVRRVGAERAVAFVSRLAWYHGRGSEMVQDIGELPQSLGDGLTRQVRLCSTPPRNPWGTS